MDETAPVEIWMVAHDQADHVVAALRRSLSVDEKERADRYRFPKDTRAFIVTRGALRQILATVLCQDYPAVTPAAICFRYSPRGKPFLDEVYQSTAVQFSVSHSAGLSLVAVRRDKGVGVDIEEIHAVPEMDGILRQHFTVAEREAVYRLAAHERLQAFFQAWCCKEAVLKGIGEGLGMEARRVEVEVEGDGKVRLLHIDGQSCVASGWQAASLVELPRTYCAALALQDGWAEVQWLTWAFQGRE